MEKKYSTFQIINSETRKRVLTSKVDFLMGNSQFVLLGIRLSTTAICKGANLFVSKEV